MNKDKIYNKVQDLFPSSLGVGDVVEVRDKQECEVLKVDGNQLLLLDNKGGTFWWFDYVANLIRKRITTNMMLDKINESTQGKDYWYIMDTGGDIFKQYRDKSKEDEWQERYLLRKNGKDQSLYDQSIDMIKLVYEILK